MEEDGKVEICCAVCHTITATSPNDWLHFDEEHIVTKQKPWYTATRVKERHVPWPSSSNRMAFFSITSSEANCTKCGARLGEYCRSGRGADAKPYKEHVIYLAGSIYLRDVHLSQPVDFFIEGQRRRNVHQVTTTPSDQLKHPTDIANTSYITMGASDTMQASNADSLDSNGSQNTLSALNGLRNRVAAVERCMSGMQATLKQLTDMVFQNRRETMLEDLEATCRAARDASSSWHVIGNLKAENENLRQRLAMQSNPAEKRSKHVTRSKGLAGSATSKSPSMVSFGLNEPAQLSSQDALNQITGAVGPETVQSPRADQGSASWLDEVLPRDLEQSLSNSGEADQLLHHEDEAAPTQGLKRGAQDAADEDEAVAADDHARKKRELTLAFSVTSGTDHVTTEKSEISTAGTEANRSPRPSSPDHQMDPAATSAAVQPSNPLPETSSQNHDDVAVAAASADNRSTTTKTYDSIHEARIQQYKDRDALRKRISNAKTRQRMQQAHDVNFRKEDKIRQRDQMVQQLMEREEGLGHEDDL